MRLPGDPTVYRFVLVGIVNTLFGTAIPETDSQIHGQRTPVLPADLKK